MALVTVKRREDVKPTELRASGFIPAVVYGGDRQGSAHISIETSVFEKLYDQMGEATLIDFQVEGEKEPVKVLIQDVQYDPAKGKVLHADFKQIKMGEAMTATVELKILGESLAVKELGGTLVENLTHVDIKCLPKDLVSHIDVDVSVLKTFNDVIKVKDLRIPSTITIMGDLETMVVAVEAPLSEEQLKAMEEVKPASLDQIEVAGKEKKAEEEGAPAEAEANKETKK
ncbi:MAG: 50S ribosomal protein L25 [Candidatus Magasanikbacteria bacterium]|nr:50S ribosomal protein L25 [Candidatus Magasanikbacteria bacterium]